MFVLFGVYVYYRQPVETVVSSTCGCTRLCSPVQRKEHRCHTKLHKIEIKPAIDAMQCQSKYDTGYCFFKKCTLSHSAGVDLRVSSQAARISNNRMLLDASKKAKAGRVSNTNMYIAAQQAMTTSHRPPTSIPTA